MSKIKQETHEEEILYIELVPPPKEIDHRVIILGAAGFIILLLGFAIYIFMLLIK